MRGREEEGTGSEVRNNRERKKGGQRPTRKVIPKGMANDYLVGN